MIFGGGFLLVALFILNSTHRPLLSAAGYTIIITIVNLLTNVTINDVLIISAISLVYMTIFFIILEKASNNSTLWWSILVCGVALWLWITYASKTA